jgi:hypothetical protein
MRVLAQIGRPRFVEGWLRGWDGRNWSVGEVGVKSDAPSSKISMRRTTRHGALCGVVMGGGEWSGTSVSASWSPEHLAGMTLVAARKTLAPAP